MRQIWLDFISRPVWRKICDTLLVLFALAGIAIFGAWGLYQLGITNNRGAVERNYRYLATVGEMEQGAKGNNGADDAAQQWAHIYGRMAAISRFYPNDAHTMLEAAIKCGDPLLIDRMLQASSMYVADADSIEQLCAAVEQALNAVPQRNAGRIVPWMNEPEWQPLCDAIAADSALINEAGRLTGVEPRLIVGCLIGEQIRLYNSKREVYKKYLAPMKVLNVQSQFSYGVNGIKDQTAKAVEEHLVDPTSEFYMGSAYEHLLDFTTDDHDTERYNRLVDYRNHLYSYLYTGCILHQTMLQWRRAGYDISNRPDVLFTLFNLGFQRSQPKADPMPGGSLISVGDSEYTFGAIGFDFYYSGELYDVFPYMKSRFADDVQPLSSNDVERIQNSMSDCNRPERGSEYRRTDSATTAPATTYQEPPDPFGIDHNRVVPIEHTAQ